LINKEASEAMSELMKGFPEAIRRSHERRSSAK
jgi:hypothetical protein